MLDLMQAMATERWYEEKFETGLQKHKVVCEEITVRGVQGTLEGEGALLLQEEHASLVMEVSCVNLQLGINAE